MISYDFHYVRPTSIVEAIELCEAFDHDGKNPVYFSGGTEIITLGRLNEVQTGAVIDIKSIPECNRFEFEANTLVIGATKTLTDIEEINHFPLLSKTVSEIADRTARNKITVGGNICGQIFYREAVLPFLLTDSEVIIGSKDGPRTQAIKDIFKEKLQLNRGEFLVQLKTKRMFLDQPFLSIKRRRQWDTGYPLITVAALKVEEKVRIAISGLTSYPFRSPELEDALNAPNQSLERRIDAAIRSLHVDVLDDSEGSNRYRLFVLKRLLTDVMTGLGGDE